MKFYCIDSNHNHEQENFQSCCCSSKGSSLVKVPSSPSESFESTSCGDWTTSPWDVISRVSPNRTGFWQWFGLWIHGGVNYVPSDTDEDTNKSLIHPDEQSTDCESIQKLKGDELEANLAWLQDLEKGSLQAPTLLNKISEPKKPLDWKQAEKKRGLGYNGHSKHTQRVTRKISFD